MSNNLENSVVESLTSSSPGMVSLFDNSFTICWDDILSFCGILNTASISLGTSFHSCSGNVSINLATFSKVNFFSRTLPCFILSSNPSNSSLDGNASSRKRVTVSLVLPNLDNISRNLIMFKRKTFPAEISYSSE